MIGVAGANPDGSFIILAGIAGLLAGAFSMGAGEFISVTSQRELFERQIALEKEELESDPEQERQELALIYRAKGLPVAEAEALSTRIIADRGVALETLAREELGLNPEGLGSPWGVAISSFAAFAAGAILARHPVVLRLHDAVLRRLGHRRRAGDVRRRRVGLAVHRPQLLLRRDAAVAHRQRRGGDHVRHRQGDRRSARVRLEVERSRRSASSR